MPQLGETVVEGTVTAWLKQPGDAVRADEPLFEVETDKVATQIPAPASGVLASVLVGTGTTARVGARLAVIEEPGARATRPSLAVQEAPLATAPAVAPHPLLPPAPRAPGGDRLPLSPLVRRLLAERKLDPSTLHGTGKYGRITPEDVRRTACAAPRPERTSVPTAGPDDHTVPFSRLRRLTAAHMLRSKALSPHAVQAVEVDFLSVEAARQRASLSYLPFVARSVCVALAEFPHINASVGQDGLIVHRRIHLGIAVDLGFEGLVIATVRDADRLALRPLAREIGRLAEAARKGGLAPDEAAGSTYTLSNSGSFGTFFSVPIINQPQVAILSLDGVRKRPVVLESADGDTLAVRPVGVLAQCFDHRAFDGAYAAAFLRRLRQVLESTNWAAEID